MKDNPNPHGDSITQHMLYTANTTRTSMIYAPGRQDEALGVSTCYPPYLTRRTET